jgi:hypothetical protein
MVRYLTNLSRFLRATSLIVGNTVILILICFLIAEWWARSAVPPKPETTTITVSNQYGAYHPWAGYRNTPGFRYELGNWVPVVVNSWGWRGPEPTIARSKSVKRALLLGDSTAFSCWGCREEASLGGILRRALELRTGEEWEVINTAVGAGFSHLSLGTLAHDGMQFQPDLVITFNGINDLLVLNEGSMLRMGAGLFKHSIYHTSQVEMGKVFDARTGKVNGPGIMDQLVAKSALFQAVSNSPFVVALRNHAATDGVAAAVAESPYSTARPERLDSYVNNELAMSYLAAGSGAKFVGFLQPYLSVKHKILGDSDRKAIKTTDPALLTWMDEVYPIVRAKLEKAAAEHPSFHFVDLSLMFTHEQAFADLAHLRYESLERSAASEQLASRMADEILRVLYAGKEVPNWRASHIAGTPHDWNEQAYLAANPDISALVAEGRFPNGFEHYRAAGFFEFRPSGFPSWNEQQYLAENPDVVPLIRQGLFFTGYQHYVKQGKAEGRRKGLPMHWIEDTYLAANPDVAAAVAAGKFKSGEDHYMQAGATENRKGGFSGWDEEGYLIQYGDVRNAVVDIKMFRSGIQHYLSAGIKEGRKVSLGLPAPD